MDSVMQGVLGTLKSTELSATAKEATPHIVSAAETSKGKTNSPLHITISDIPALRKDVMQKFGGCPPLTDEVQEKYDTEGSKCRGEVRGYYFFGPLVTGQEPRFALYTMAEGFIFFIDVADAALDFQFVEQLLRKGYKGYGTMLAVNTSLSLIVNVYALRPWVRWNPWASDDPDRLFYMVCGEMFVYYVEDATTMYIWSQTATFTNDFGSLANMATTLVSAVITMLLVFHSCWKKYKGGSGVLPNELLVFPLLGTLFAIGGIAYVGVGVLLPAARNTAHNDPVDGEDAVYGVDASVLLGSCICGWVISAFFFVGFLGQFLADKPGMRHMMDQDNSAPRCVVSLCQWVHCFKPVSTV